MRKNSAISAGWLFGVAEPRLVAVLLEIVEKPAADHTIASLARAAGMSRSGFAARFALTFGRSPISFLRRVRMRQAARMLERTDLPVARVAQAVGYSSRSFFSRAFRQAFGSDPRSFRSVHRD